MIGQATNHAAEVKRLTKELEHATSKRDQWAERIAELRRSLQVATRQQREVVVSERRLELANATAEWKEKSATLSGRWSPRWWASHGWAKLAQEVGASNLGAVVAVFAELEPRNQYVLEHYYGLGVPKRSLRAIGVTVPRASDWFYGDWSAYGISPEQVRQILARSYRIMRINLEQDDFLFCGNAETCSNKKRKPFVSHVFRHGGLGKDNPQETK